MIDRAQRRADERAKLAAMPLTKRIAIVLAGIVATIVGASLISVLLEGGINIALTALLAVAMGIVLAYQFLWVPSRRP